jgi:hypothetical protein
MSDGVNDIIPISRLFFDDAGPHILEAGASTRNPDGTTLAWRSVTPGAPQLAQSIGAPVAAAGRYTPARGRALHDLLNTSIAQLGGVSGETRKTPAASLPPPVPIDALLYRGRAALDRALEIRGEARQSGQPLTAESVEELLDLVGLAAEE